MATEQKPQLADIKASLRASTENLNTLLTSNKIDISEELSDIPIRSLIKPKFNQRLLIENRYKALETSLSEHGFVGGIFISKETNHVIDGWHRVRCWEELGNSTIPCFFIKCTEQQEKELHLRLNTQAAQFDLANIGATFPTLNLIKDFGFSETDLTPRTQKSTLAALEKIAKEQPDTKKFSTTLQKTCYQQLEEIKEENKLADWSDVIEILIEAYNAKNSN